VPKHHAHTLIHRQGINDLKIYRMSFLTTVPLTVLRIAQNNLYSIEW
jgi:hypothetical protein